MAYRRKKKKRRVPYARGKKRKVKHSKLKNSLAGRKLGGKVTSQKKEKAREVKSHKHTTKTAKKKNRKGWGRVLQRVRSGGAKGDTEGKTKLNYL